MYVYSALYTWATSRFAFAGLAGFALFFTLDVLGNLFLGFRIAGEPTRLMPEEDLALILLVVEGLRLLWNRGRVLSGLAVAVTLVSFSTALPYVRHAWGVIVPDANYQDRVEYKLTEWMATHLPQARAVATGSVRFWYDAWHDLPQIGGGSDQGVSNQLANMAYTQVTNDSLEVALQWMQSLGVDALIVHDKKSREVYHDYVNPQQYVGLPVLYDNHQGDVIYRVPRRFTDLARVAA